MASFPYADLANDAQELIEAAGRACTFARLGRAPVDPAKPWRAPTADPDAVDGPPLSIPDIIAAIVPDERQPEKGEIARRSTATLYVAHNSFVAAMGDDPVPDIETFDTVADGTTTWHIDKVEPVAPGTVKVIYTMYLRS